MFERCSAYYGRDGSRVKVKNLDGMMRELDIHSKQGLRFIAVPFHSRT